MRLRQPPWGARRRPSGVVNVQDRPTAIELVDAVREFLADEVGPTLDGRLEFQNRVALNVLAIVARELELGAAQDIAQRARLVALLGHDTVDDTADDTAALEAELAAAIRAGALSDRGDEVLAHVRATVREKLLVANPKYLET